jgi:hypothetical protein
VGEVVVVAGAVDGVRVRVARAVVHQSSEFLAARLLRDRGLRDTGGRRQQQRGDEGGERPLHDAATIA